MTHETDDAAPLPNPDGCRWCGADKYAHHQRWTPDIGFHTWTAPTSEQRKARMIERRRAAGNLMRLLAVSLRGPATA